MVAVLGGSRWRAIYHVPLLLALSLEEQAGTCVHELPTLPPSRSSLPPSLPPGGDLTQRGERESENMGLLESARVLKCIFTVSIKTQKCWDVHASNHSTLGSFRDYFLLYVNDSIHSRKLKWPGFWGIVTLLEPQTENRVLVQARIEELWTLCHGQVIQKVDCITFKV